MNIKKRSSGFTLIELIFVIAIMGILSTVGILFYQQRMQNQKIEKTVSQMEQWMQAGMAYYIKNGEWPPNATKLITDGFMPDGSANSNPWCSAGSCYEVKQHSTKPQLFTVTAKISTGGRSITNAIAARLPLVEPPVPEGSVTGIVNIPLASLERPQPDTILVRIQPFKLFGQHFGLIRNQQNPSVSVLSADNYSLGLMPDCSRYGAVYDAYTAVVVSEYGAIDNNTDLKQPLFAGIEAFTFPSTGNKQPVSLIVNVRPQDVFTVTNGVYLPTPFIRTQVTENMRNALRVSGSVYFYCKKKPTLGNGNNIDQLSAFRF